MILRLLRKVNKNKCGKTSKDIGRDIQEARLAPGDETLVPFQKGAVADGKPRRLGTGLKMEKGLAGVSESPEAEQGEQEKVEEVKQFVIDPQYRGGDFLRGEGKEDPEEDGIAGKNEPAAQVRKIP